jgi:hypothetical protein
MAKTKSKRRGRPQLTPAQARRVRAALVRLIADLGSASAAAVKLNLSVAGVTQLRDAKNSPSSNTAIAVARATGTTLSALLGEA